MQVYGIEGAYSRSLCVINSKVPKLYPGLLNFTACEILSLRKFSRESNINDKAADMLLRARLYDRLQGMGRPLMYPRSKPDLHRCKLKL